MATHAYALKEGVDPEGFSAGVGYRNGETLQISDLLEQGGGVYVTDDPQEQEVLDGYGHVKRVTLEEAERTYKPRRGGAGAKSQAAGDEEKA